ncbi:MAG TPA: hypothetical protein VFF30_02550, partial [Nitrososphaerales archaeon]|nr:hypothetical protein [Nitrososphaerales archaeon]
VCEHGERDGAQGIHLQLVHCCGDVKKEAFREHTEEGIKTSYSCNRAPVPDMSPAVQADFIIPFCPSLKARL